VKRMACPACGKPLLVPAGYPGKPFPCPTCKRQLVRVASGLTVAGDDNRLPATPANRPKSEMVPVTAPVRKPLPVMAEPLKTIVPPQPKRVEAKRRPWWFVPVAGGAAFVAAAAAVTIVVALLPRSGPLDGEVEIPSLLSPLGPSGSKSDKVRARPKDPGKPEVSRARPLAAAAATSDARRASEAGATAGPAKKPVELHASLGGGDPIQAVLRSVAVVEIPGEGHGSGFMVAPGILVTNHHVIQDALIRDLRISFPDNDAVAGRQFRAELIHLNIPNDLAFLATAADVPPLRIKEQCEHVNGQRVVAVGSPSTGGDGPTLENLTTDGRLGPELTLDGDVKHWALSMAVNGGNSGGPLLDAQTGEVMGVIVAKFTKTEAQSLAIPHASLVRELAGAGKVSEDGRAAVLSLHRQRYCLRRMAGILGVTSFAFDHSVAAAVANSDEGAAGMDAAFNECKTLAARAFAEQFADFSGTVGGEVADLQKDPRCDPRVRRGLQKLLDEIEEQADEIRRRVPREEIEAFLGRFRGSVEGSRALVVSLAERLQLDPSETLEEE
jgi:S1-C subfamily serine protease